MEEQWIVIEEAPNYQVSNLGRIWNASKKRELRGGVNSEGYLLVTLRHNNKDVQRSIHRLVAIYHIPNPNNLPEVNHKKGIKIDNRASELEWCTKEYNLTHALETGLRKLYTSGKDNAKKQIKDVLTGEVFNSLKEAALAKGINYNTFRTMLSGRQSNTSGCIYLQ